MVAEFEHGRGRIGVRALAPEHPLARLAPGENLVRLWTPVHAQVPIAIGGPGAGPEVTAAGVLGDVLEAARALQARAAPGLSGSAPPPPATAPFIARRRPGPDLANCIMVWAGTPGTL